MSEKLLTIFWPVLLFACCILIISSFGYVDPSHIVDEDEFILSCTQKQTKINDAKTCQPAITITTNILFCQLYFSKIRKNTSIGVD